MTAPIEAGAATPTERPARATLWAKSRLVLALVATVTLLPYAWGRSLLMSMMIGRPEWYYAGMLAAGLAVVIALTFRLSSKFRSPHVVRNTGAVVAVLWTAVVGGIVLLNAGRLISPFVVAAGFLPATVWVVWCAWMFFAPIRTATRVSVLAVSAALVLPFLLLFRIDGLTGAAQVNFDFRRNAAPRSEPEWGEPAAPSKGISLESTGGDEFAQFLGPGRTAVLAGPRLARDWKTSAPKVLWNVPVGAGWSGFAVAGDGAVTQEQRGDLECVVCRNLLTGEEVWVHADPAHYENALGGPGPRGTPTIDGGLVYAIGATGILNCLDGTTGKPRWSVNILEDNETKNAFHGVCGSPLVFGDYVVVCPTGKEGSSLAAYDRRDGRRLWAHGAGEASYSSPLLADVAGVRLILYYNQRGIAAHDPLTGEDLWSYPWSNSEKVVCSQPVVLPGESGGVLLTTGYGGGSALIRTSCDSEGRWLQPEPVWTSRTMKTKFTTAVARGDYVYGLDDGILQCVDLQTGKAAWKRGRYGHGQLLLVDDLLLIQSEPGDVVLVEANPSKLVELARVPALDGKTWNCPALAGRYFVTRNDHQAVCLELPLAAD